MIEGDHTPGHDRDIEIDKELTKEDMLLLAQTDDKTGIYSLEGTLIKEAEFEDVDSLGQGMAAVKIDDKWGYIDVETKDIVIEPRFDKARAFSQGLAPVEKDGDMGYIDKEGNILVEPAYDQAFEFEKGLARIKIANDMGYINTEGEYIYGPPKPPEPEDEIQITTTPWDDTQLITHIFQKALEIRGYDSEVLDADVGAIFADVASDEIHKTDFSLSPYLPHTHGSYMEEYQDDIEK